MKKNTTVIGYASGAGAGNPGTADGPKTMENSAFLPKNISWEKTIYPETDSGDNLSHITSSCFELAKCVNQLVKNKQFFSVVGGDHACALGTWSGAAEALSGQDLGLIWFDAHCDAHTHETTPSGNIHGMPVAALMGHGHDELTNLFCSEQKLKPENLILIGIRCFEHEEHELLKSQGVKIYYADDVVKRGIKQIFKESIEYMKEKTPYYGLSFDLDGLDPSDIPAVGTPVPKGVSAKDCLDALPLFSEDPQLIGYEIVEFNPSLDQEHATERYIGEILSTIKPA